MLCESEVTVALMTVLSILDCESGCTPMSYEREERDREERKIVEKRDRVEKRRKTRRER